MHRGCMTTLATGSNGAGSAVCAVAPRPEASERTRMNGATLLIACSSRRAELALERQLAYPPARRREDRVRQCWCRNRGAWLAYPARCLRVPHQMHFDRRRLIDPQHANVVEVGLLHPAVLQGHLAPQRSEEHTSELQPRLHLVCRLLLEKKNTINVSSHSPSSSATKHASPLLALVPTLPITPTAERIRASGTSSNN